MKLYHGIRGGLDQLIRSRTLKSPSLQTYPTILNYAHSALIIAEPNLYKEQSFNISELFEQHKEQIGSIVENRFDKTINEQMINNIIVARSRSQPEDTKEFYRTSSIYFSEAPKNYNISFVMNIPDELVQNSPQGWPVVPGEVSLKFTEEVLTVKAAEKFVRSILEKYDSNIKIRTV